MSELQPPMVRAPATERETFGSNWVEVDSPANPNRTPVRKHLRS